MPTLPTDPDDFAAAIIRTHVANSDGSAAWHAWFADYWANHRGVCDAQVDHLAQLLGFGHDPEPGGLVAAARAIADATEPTTDALVVALRTDTGQFDPERPAGAPTPTDTADTARYLRLSLVTGAELRTDEAQPEYPNGWAGRYCVPWWPVIPADYRATVTDWRTLPAELLDLTADPGGRTVIHWAQTRAMLRARIAGATEALTHTHGQAAGARRIRVRTRAQRDHLQAWLTPLEALGEQLVAAYVADIEHTAATIAALLDITRHPHRKGLLPMPGLTTPAPVATLAQQIHDAITNGTGGRLQVGNQEQAFAWAGVPRTLIAHVTTAPTDGRHITTLTVSESGTPAGVVAEGAPKPNVVVFAEGSEDLAKYAGTAVITTEQAHFVRHIETATSVVLTGSILRAIEADTVTEILAQAGVSIAAAADLSAGILQAIADIAVNGGNASFVGLAPADWVALVGGLTDAPLANAYTLFGLTPVLVPTLVAGTAVVADGAGITVWEVEGAPLCVVDPYSLSGSNKINIVLETFAAPDVTSPGVVAKVTVGP